MNYVTGNYETLSTADLLAELSHAEQTKGYSAEIRTFEIREEIEKRFADRVETIEEKPAKVETVEAVEAVEINVFFETGYKWSVDINGGESVDSSLTKAEAMKLARSLKKQFKKAVINEQKLTKAEKAENISWLHENSYNYTKF